MSKAKITSNGFSLIEILVSITLLTGVSLILLQQQWQLRHYYQKLQRLDLVNLQRDNKLENQ